MTPVMGIATTLLGAAFIVLAVGSNNLVIRSIAVSLLVTLLTSEDVCARELSVHGGGYSHHLLSENTTNSTHDLGAIQWGSWVAGRFNNSFDRETYFAAYEWSWQLTRHVEAFVWGGATRGYTTCFGGRGDNTTNTCALVAPGVRYTRYALQPALLFVADAASLEARYVF